MFPIKDKRSDNLIKPVDETQDGNYPVAIKHDGMED